ncbi:MAG TPA: hypothetical protein VE983_10730 [Solirubrobacteraceae bacterium]|nr:hypothetical protein [Solirubrobacteraceae bacterium]
MGASAIGSLATLAVCCALCACGGSSDSAALHTPRNVCRQARRALTAAAGPAVLRITRSDPANIECLLQARGLRVDVVAQASPRAWEQFDTVVVHQAQAFGGFAAPHGRDMPQDVAGLGYNAAWIPVNRELVATNGTQSSGGSFVTVTITRRSPQAPSGLKVAKAVATATLAVALKGASPGPAPS